MKIKVFLPNFQKIYVHSAINVNHTRYDLSMLNFVFPFFFFSYFILFYLLFSSDSADVLAILSKLPCTLRSSNTVLNLLVSN